ncbi:MAG: SAM-dependent methyltransferase [Rhodospirillaceae bacterium]
MSGVLLEHLLRRIRIDGPISVAEFMATALGHPEHGYYMTADRFGTAGDFVTAPEISQMFGELIGLWCADYWQRMGCPAPFTLVELGPGRGTLMADALRAVSGVMPAFVAACRLHLVETSPLLRRRQGEALARFQPHWQDRLSEVPDGGPLLLVANEFFDALPVRQFERTSHGWSERLIGAAERNTLHFVLGPPNGPTSLMIPPRLRAAEIPLGTVIDLAPVGNAVALELGRRLTRAGGAALIIDYGHTAPVPTDTLQAVRHHTPVSVLESPGEADLTTHVDFAALARAAGEGGAVSYGPLTQSAFLTSCGIETRAATLRRKASVEQTRDIDSALRRLTANDAMGTLFKVLALTGPKQPVPACFEPPTLL